MMHVGIANQRWRGKRSQHSRCMRNTQLCVSGKRTIATSTKPRQNTAQHKIAMYSVWLSVWLIPIFIRYFSLTLYTSLYSHIINIRRTKSLNLNWLSIPVFCSIHITITFQRYRQTSSIKGTKSQNLNVSRLVLHISLPNPLEPGVKWRMKM